MIGKKTLEKIVAPAVVIAGLGGFLIGLSGCNSEPPKNDTQVTEQKESNFPLTGTEQKEFNFPLYKRLEDLPQGLQDYLAFWYDSDILITPQERKISKPVETETVISQTIDIKYSPDGKLIGTFRRVQYHTGEYPNPYNVFLTFTKPDGQMSKAHTTEAGMPDQNWSTSGPIPLN